MTKLLPSLVLAVALIGGAAAPALASSLTSSDGGSFDASYQLYRLQGAGVPAVAVAEDNADTMRVTIRLDDGSQVFTFFDIDSLQQKGGQTGARVLSQVDAGQKAPLAISRDSLTRNTWGD
jgi:hypothetical protein